MDASYGVYDSRNTVQYSISSGADTPFERSKFFWSATEKTFLVFQNSDEGKEYDRFVVVRLGDEGESEYWLLKRKPLENRHFAGKSAAVDSVTDGNVTFLLDDGRAKQIGLNELGAESRRQEQIAY